MHWPLKAIQVCNESGGLWCFRTVRRGTWSWPRPDTTLLILKADVSKAHRRIKILPSGWKYQVAQIDQQWWVNKVGTYGVASAQLYWGRMAALLLRLLYYSFPEVDWGFVFVDDFCWLLRSTNCNSLTPALLAFLVALGVPLSWKKTALSEINTWLGFVINPSGPFVQMARDKHCVHFRFGRFGDELLFGAQAFVLYVHFGSRPKWTCKVQHKGFVFLPGVSWFSWGATPTSLMAMDAPRDAAQAHAEAVKVETWCRKEGIKTSAELAFYFTSFDEALSEAGRAVARSWQVARQSSEQGVAGLVRGLFTAEKQSQEVVPVAGRPKPSLAMAPVAGKKRGYVQADEKPLVLDEGAMQQFMDMLVSIGQHRAGDARALTNFKAIVREVLTRSEPATVKRGLQTWQEMRLALSGSDVVGVDAHFCKGVSSTEQSLPCLALVGAELSFEHGSCFVGASNKAERRPLWWG